MSHLRCLRREALLAFSRMTPNSTKIIPMVLSRFRINPRITEFIKVIGTELPSAPSCEQSWFLVRLNEGIIILPHQESLSACLNKKELSQTRANCVRISPTRANCVRFTPNCKIRHLRREALLGCSAFLELLALTFWEVRAIPVSE